MEKAGGDHRENILPVMFGNLFEFVFLFGVGCFCYSCLFVVRLGFAVVERHFSGVLALLAGQRASLDACIEGTCLSSGWIV